jgi:multiple sugar transport system permease protein
MTASDNLSTLTISQSTVTEAQVKRNKLIRDILRFGLILLITVIFAFPFIWMVIASFQRQIDIISPGFAFTPTTANYERVLDRHSFNDYLVNTVIIAVASTGISLFLGLPASYAVARFKYNFLGLVLLTARIIPGITLLLPWHILFSRIGLHGSYIALIASHIFVSMPFVVWVMVPFFEALPTEIEESARIDGATMVGTFIRIVLPLATPGIITAGIMSFIFSWNNFMFALMLSSDETRTLPVAIFNFMSYSSIDWGGLMAAAVLITLPVLIVTIFMQRYIVSGLTAGAMKG